MAPAALQQHALVTVGLPATRKRDRATARFETGNAASAFTT
jgi:hypothetical protein